MRSRIWLAIALSLCASTPMFAQSDSAIAAKLDTLSAVIGDYHKVIPCSELDNNRPSLILGDGGYPERFRLKQIGCAIDAAVERVRIADSARLATEARFEGVVEKLAALENRLITAEAKIALGSLPPAEGGSPSFNVLTVYRLRVTDKICLGDQDCNNDWTSRMQIRANGDANIGLESNIAGNNPQSPRRHIGQVSLSGDGGVRMQQNCMGTFSRGYYCNVDPCREATNIGTDSRGSWSFYRISVQDGADPFTGNGCTPLPHDPTQDFVLTTDESVRRTLFYIWRPNWELIPIGSSCITCMDRPGIPLVPRQ